MNILLRYTLAFIVGIFVGTYYEYIAYECLYSLIAVCILCALICLPQKKSTARYGLGGSLLVLFILLGWLRTAQVSSQPVLAENIEAYQVIINSNPEIRAKTYKAEAKIVYTKYQKGWHSTDGKVLLYISKNSNIPQYGDVLLIKAKPQLVSPPLNPYQFDYKSYLAHQGIYYQHFVRKEDFVIVNQNKGSWFKSWAYSINAWCDKALHELIPLEREYAVAKAMLLGVRDEMDNTLVNAYSAAGAVHILSVSGFHIMVFMAILTFAFGFLQKRKHGQILYISITLIVLWFYAVLTGLSAPVVRAALMFSIYLLAKPLARQSNTLNSLFTSALIILAINPLQLYAVSFQLSYLALGGIIVLQPPLYQAFSYKNLLADKLWAITTVALAAQVITFPISAYYFHQFPTYFLIANPIVVLLGSAMLPVGIVGISLSRIPYLSTLLGWVLTRITWLLNEAIIYIEKLSLSTLNGLSLTLLELVIIYLLIGLWISLVYYRQLKFLWGLIPLTLLLLSWQVSEIMTHRHQKIVVVHAVPNQTVISLIYKQHAFLLADSSFFQPNNQPYNFYLKKLYTTCQLKTVTQQAFERPNNIPLLLRKVSFGELIVWQGYSILILDKPIASLPIKADLVLVRGGKFKNLDEINKIATSQNIVFDNSTKSYQLERFQQEAIKMDLPYYFIHQKGAWIKYIQ